MVNFALALIEAAVLFILFFRRDCKQTEAIAGGILLILAITTAVMAAMKPSQSSAPCELSSQVTP